LVKEIDDPKAKANYSYAAALLARDEKDYKLSIKILDSIDQSQWGNEFGWRVTRTQVAASYLSDNFKNEDFDKVNEIIAATPDGLKQFVVIDAIRNLGAIAENHKMESFKLLNLARAEFGKMEITVPSEKSPLFQLSPLALLKLVDLYERVGFHDEALDTLREFVKFQNRISGSFVGMNRFGEPISYFYYTTLPRKLVESDFDAICADIGQIEPTRARVAFRLHFLWENTRNGSIGESGLIELN
jgi:hypothetical protein